METNAGSLLTLAPPSPQPVAGGPSVPTGSMARVGAFVVRYRRAVLVLWFVIGVAGLALVGDATSRLSSNESLPGLSSYATSQRILHLYGTGADNPPDVLVISLAPETGVRSAPGRAEVATALAPLDHDRSLRVLSYPGSGDAHLVAADGHTTVALVFGGNNQPSSSALAARVRAHAPPGVQVSGTNYYDLAGDSAGGLSVLAEAMVAGAGALIVLALVFGSLLALVPLLVAVVSILSTFLVIGALTALAPVSNLVEYLIALIGLGVAIDYSLLVVTRWREERAEGRPNADAVAAAVATAGRTVAFSGVTVGIGLLALVVLPLPFLRSLGYAGILIPLVSVVVAVTLLPALLASVGPRLEWPHRRQLRAARVSRAWSAWGRMVVAHRQLAALTSVAALATLLVFASGMRVGEPLPGSLSTQGPAATGLQAMERAGFPVGLIVPVEVLVPEGPGAAPAASVADRLARLPGAYTAVAPSGPDWRRDGTALVDVLPRAADTTPSNTVFLDSVEAATNSTNVGQATGDGLVELELVHALYDRFALIVALVAAVSFAVLSLAFRSVVLALKALALNVLSIGAAMGALVLVWQRGYLSHLIWGIPATGAVVDFVPLMVFAFLFGLSMDYEVFIVSRVREAHDNGAPTSRAIVTGVARTGRLVTCAALVLVLAFIALGAGPEVPLKMFATGLGAGILIDATIVRALLLPALLALLGERCWWRSPSRRRRSPAPA